LKLNKIEGNYQVLQLDWAKCAETIPDSEEEANKFDVILGSDIIYSKESLSELVKTVKYLLKKEGYCLLANHVIRMNKLEELLSHHCEQQKLFLSSEGYIGEDGNIKLHKITQM